VGERSVLGEEPEREEQDGAAEFHALGGGAGDQRRGNDREHQLIDHERGLRDRTGVVGIRIGANTPKESMLEAPNYRAVAAEG
jgi:hypothetical protein